MDLRTGTASQFPLIPDEDNENQETIILSGTSLSNIDNGQPSIVDNAWIIT